MVLRQYNPYDSRSPAVGNRFIGRESELEQITAGNIDAIVFGYSRWGKTSLLKNAANLVQTGQSESVYIPESGKDSAELAQSIKIKLPESIAKSAKLDNKNSVEGLFLKLNSYYGSQVKRLYFFLDETERLFRDESAVRQFRAFNQDMANLTFVYSIFPHVFEAMQISTSRFQDSAKMIPLTPFGMEETRSLVEICTDAEKMRNIASENPVHGNYEFKPFSLDGQITQQVYFATGGLPFLTQGLMSELINQSRRSSEPLNLTAEKFKDAYDYFSIEIREQLAHLWNSLTALQKQILEIVVNEEGISEKDLQSKVHPQNPSIWYGAINPLSDRGIGLINSPQGQGCIIRGAIMRDTIRHFAENFKER